MITRIVDTLLMWAAIVLVGIWSICCNEPEDTRAIFDCRIKIDFSQVPEVFGVKITWDSLAIQYADEELGPNPPGGHGVMIDKSWVELPTHQVSTKFVRSKKEFVSIYENASIVTQVGRIWPKALRVEGYLASRQPIVVTSILEPIVVEFPLLKNRKTSVHVELVLVRNRGTQLGTYSLYTKSARWIQGVSL